MSDSLDLLNLKIMLTANAREVQRNYRRLFDQVKKDKEPLFLLKGSSPEMVVLSIEMYEDLLKGANTKIVSSDHSPKTLPWRN